ncbi:hypothetical protein H5410_060057 [Solanum commersonii]|uniref:Uncharacterized protein n=1 Tax=Solanum commersonii TaxID=4109 RepID=A0A9J5W421_SOLCO|nr:hypothetical protein H5410_060057 [Solanum commersonii]
MRSSLILSRISFAHLPLPQFELQQTLLSNHHLPTTGLDPIMLCIRETTQSLRIDLLLTISVLNWLVKTSKNCPHVTCQLCDKPIHHVN